MSAPRRPHRSLAELTPAERELWHAIQRRKRAWGRKAPLNWLELFALLRELGYAQAASDVQAAVDIPPIRRAA